MADDEHNQEQEAVDAEREHMEQLWEQRRLEEERLEQERLDSEEKRLKEATREQIKLGPKGLYPGVEFDFARWQRNAKGYRRGICLYSDLLILAWCRIYLSVVPISSDTMLIHYSFENLYDGDLPLNLEDSLFNSASFDRYWSIEDMTNGETNKGSAYMTGFSSQFKRENKGVNLILSPNQFSVLPTAAIPGIATVTRTAFREADGSWFSSDFGKCLPGHTYEFQLDYGGLLSNVFTWTAPD